MDMGDQSHQSLSGDQLYHPKHNDPVTGKEVPEKTLCHLFITDGQIKFCGDCVHDLNGTTVPLCDWPENYFVPEDG